MNVNDLVSIVVVTYNSSPYVIETLESVKQQTYQNIELIVTDDSSTDDTIAKATKWIDDNSQRFTNVKIVITTQNGGISKNCNQGYKNTQAEYLKFIAGDDLLLQNCIQDNVDFVINNTDASIVFSDMILFGENIEDINLKQCFMDDFVKKIDVDAKTQFQRIIKREMIIANSPSVFIKKELLDKMGGFDERFPMLDDLPLWTKIAYNGIKLYYFDKKTVMYRIGYSSASALLSKNPVNGKALASYYQYCVMVRAKHLSGLDYWDNLIQILIFKLCFICGNKRSALRALRCLNLLNPKAYWRKIKKLYLQSP